MTLFPLLVVLLASPGTEGAPAGVLSVQEAAPQVPQWTGALTLGLTWTDGNTQNETLNGYFNATR